MCGESMAGNRRANAGKSKKKGGLSGPFGRYEIIEEVGKGAMGVVYRARHTAMGNIIALKILHPKISKKPKLISRFLTEAMASGRLSHPNVVRGIDAGEVEGRHFFAMEFVDGPPLDRILTTGGPLTERKALQITLDVAKALNHAAENNVVHRDVKPANILVANSGAAKLTDLGLAVRRDTDEESGGVTMGTPDYISPEQVRAIPDVDIRSDIYSLGITLYQMLTGCTPYSGAPNEVMGKHLTAAIPDPRREGADVSDDAVRILRKMTEKRREERYQKPLNLIRDLEAVSAGEGVAVAQAGRALASRRL
ncbi:MAG: serine/threonine-protein kinase, partial [Planctomycetota bacterium]